MAKVVCQAGPDAGHEHRLTKDRTTFGRRSSCEVQIMDSMASREHFLIRRDGKLYTVIDLESRNGTRLNDRRVTERQLEFGDRLRVGEVEYLFVKEEGDVEIKDLLTKKYQIIDKIGEGGMGIVYKAMQRSMDRTVALKILASKYASRPRFVERFIDEARAAGRLNHPNIIQVHDVDTENGVHYFSMEYIDGATCMQLLRGRGPFDTGEALEIVRQIAKALQYAHDSRIIHHDVKPDNIMVGANNLVKLADLGISKTFEEAEAEGRPKKVVGTPHYLAPEAALGKKIDHRIDIYSLGASLYHLLTNHTPFTGKTATELLKAHIKEEPPPLSQHEAKIDGSICALVAKMMAKEPGERIQSAEEVAREIQKIQDKLGLASDLSHTANETLMLRRFVAGAQTPTPSNPAIGKPTSATTSRGSRLYPRRDRPMPAALRWLLTLVVVVVIVGILLHLLGGFGSQTLRHLGILDPIGASIEDPDTPALDPVVEEGPAQPQQPPTPATDQRRREQLTALSRLKDRLTVRPDEPQLRELLQRIDEVLIAPADEQIRADARSLRESVVARLEQLETADEQERFRRLRDEIDELRQSRDFDAALQRLRAFKVLRAEDIRERVKAIESEIDNDRHIYLEFLKQRLEYLGQRRDAAGLRQLRDGLPRSMLDQGIAKDIDKTLKELDLAIFEQRSQLLKEARSSLLIWDLGRVHRVFQEQQAAFAGSAQAAQLQQLEDLAQGLEALIAQMDERLKSAGKKPRYPGTLHGFRDPDLIGAALREGLSLRPPNGGEAQIPWKLLSQQQLLDAVDLALGTDAPSHRATLDALWAHRSAAAAEE